MQTLVDQVAWKEQPDLKPCTVMTRRVRWLFLNRSRTTVLPNPMWRGADALRSAPGFIIWWNSDDPDVLRRVHAAMVQTISRIGYIEAALRCGPNRHQHEARLASLIPGYSPGDYSLDDYWRDQLGETIFSYYRKAT